jgi:hypothetical protein
MAPEHQRGDEIKEADRDANDGMGNFSEARAFDFKSGDPKGVHYESHTCAQAAQY